MRFEGHISAWDDEEDQGLIKPTQGGQDIRVHGHQLPRGLGAWAVGDALSFEIASDDLDGKQAVKLQRPAPPPTPIQRLPGRPLADSRPPPRRGHHRVQPRWPRRVGLALLAALSAWVYLEASRWHAARNVPPSAAPASSQTLGATAPAETTAQR